MTTTRHEWTRALMTVLLLLAASAGCNSEPAAPEGEWRKPLGGGAYEMIRFSPGGGGEIARLGASRAGRTFAFRYERAGENRLKIAYEKAPGPLLDEGPAGYVTYEHAGDSLILSGEGVLPAVSEREVYYRSGTPALAQAETRRQKTQARAGRVRAAHRLERALRQIAEEARYWKRDQRYRASTSAESDFSGLTWERLRRGMRLRDASVSGDTFRSQSVEAVITSRTPLVIEGASREDPAIRGTARVGGPGEENVRIEVSAGRQ